MRPVTIWSLLPETLFLHDEYYNVLELCKKRAVVQLLHAERLLAFAKITLGAPCGSRFEVGSCLAVNYHPSLQLVKAANLVVIGNNSA